MMRKHLPAFFMVTLLVVSGCGNGTGNLQFTTWGEEYIEQQIPATAFEDGWQVKFTTFLVNIGNIQVADADGNTGASMNGTVVVNHVFQGEKPVFSVQEIEAKPWTDVSFEVPVATPEAKLGDGVIEWDRDFLVEKNASLYVTGEATKGEVTKKFAWTFSKGTRYTECSGDRDGKVTQGALITNGGTDAIELTIHGDHLFYDDLQSPNALLRFNPIAAADADNDGQITLDELANVPLVEIEDGPYGTGSAADINDLGAFVTALSGTVGHFRGEGECFGEHIQ
ncbi:MAG: hypothetical protein IPK82_05145 [Polyangiaceae bacterium]|nr:hypothetical protein [Polyangiaceae bacterium]